MEKARFVSNDGQSNMMTQHWVQLKQGTRAATTGAGYEQGGKGKARTKVAKWRQIMGQDEARAGSRCGGVSGESMLIRLSLHGQVQVNDVRAMRDRLGRLDAGDSSEVACRLIRGARCRGYSTCGPYSTISVDWPGSASTRGAIVIGVQCGTKGCVEYTS